MRPSDPEALAFAGALSQAERVIDGQTSERARWLRAYLACARGDLDAAEALAAPLAATAEDLRVWVRAAITLASALRQEGRHKEAVEHDRRALVRLAWVRAEHALLLGRPREAARHAREALGRSSAAGFRRHEAKSLLFLGAALESAGDPRAAATLADAQRVASAIGARAVAAAAAALRARARVRGVP